uniref:Uncharacterized protein n=1 Tax=Tanacetum cinerariifolium TaxID=118510 RepID=A0A6L2KSC6_TANCI|nr:hypothetical protein [Tanacetum cinerariifolium]
MRQRNNSNKAYGMCPKKQKLAYEKENDPNMLKKNLFIMAQQIIPADQLFPKFQSIGRCNNYVVLKNISCSPECKIVGQLLLDHPLSYALTTTTDVPALPLETPANPFITPATMKVIEPFMQTVGYQGVCDKEYETVFVMVVVPTIQPQPVVSTQGTHRTTPSAHRSPTLTTDIASKKKRKQVAGETSSPRKFLKLRRMFLKFRRSWWRRILKRWSKDRARSHKKNPKNVDDDDDENDKEKKDEKKDDDKKKVDAEDKDNDDHAGHILVGTQATGIMEIWKEKMQTPISPPCRSPRKNLSSDKNLSHELTETISPSTAKTSKAKCKSRFISRKSKILPGSIAGMCKRRGLITKHLKSTFVTNEYFQGKVHEFLDKINNLAPEMINTTLNLYPTTSSSNATTSTANIQHQLYLTMESNHQDQAADPKLWDILKANEEARLSIHHWKDSWHKRMYKLNQRRVRDNPEEYFSNHKITEVVRVTTNQQHGLDYMEQIIVMRENDKPNSFSEAGFKYLNKNDIEDLYYLFGNRKLPDQVKLNRHDPYSIVDKPNTGLIYLNNKEEKKVMYLAEIAKFCDATLEIVLKEVNLKIFKSEPWKKPPLLGELDLDILKAYKREITKRLRHRMQMRRWESFVNERPILPAMRRL